MKYHRGWLVFQKKKEQLEYWSYQLMSIDRIFSKLQGVNLFPRLDLRSGYYNITVAEEVGEEWIVE